MPLALLPVTTNQESTFMECTDIVSEQLLNSDLRELAFTLAAENCETVYWLLNRDYYRDSKLSLKTHWFLKAPRSPSLSQPVGFYCCFCIVSGVATLQALVSAAACNGSVSDFTVKVFAVVYVLLVHWRRCDANCGRLAIL